jgi:hypothetical protein
VFKHRGFSFISGAMGVNGNRKKKRIQHKSLDT